MNSLQARFEQLCMPEPNTGCWLWLGALSAERYGCMSINGRSTKANRVAWLLYRSEIPNDLCVLHRCDVPLCVNPDHLFLGTQIDNISDRDRKLRHRALQGELHGNAKLSETDVLEIRRLAKERSVPQKQIAARFGIHVGTVESIVGRRAWRHI